ncbi:MAG: HAD family hydrolase [Pseudomonadota bacterium]
MRIVMWSGPRNLSTALMRSFGARADTAVVDEPFYAAYLAATGIDHPMRDAVIAAGQTDWRAVAAACAAPPPPGTVRYEKQMTHHMLPGFGLDWLQGAAIAFLIRDPRAVAASYAAKREAFALADLGIERQVALFDHCAALLGRPPPVVDADALRRAPRAVLSALCAALGLAFDPAMLAWPPGPRSTDGVWGAHWYGAVNASTGFAPPPAEPPAEPPALTPATQSMLAPARALYDRLAAHALVADAG